MPGNVPPIRPKGLPITNARTLFKLPNSNTSNTFRTIEKNKIITVPGISAENDLLTTSGTLSGILIVIFF